MVSRARTASFATSVFAFLLTWGCSGSAPAGGSGGGLGVDAAAVQTPIWADGTVLSSNTTIAPGSVVTIAAGAKISALTGVSITVQGTLKASSAAGPHAKLSPPSGSEWAGIVVASGGTLALAGVDLGGADTAIHVMGGAASAQYDQGTIDGATTPFSVDSGGSLSTTRATVTNTNGFSGIAGSLVASHLSYASNGNQGIITTDLGATLSIEDSTLVGSTQTSDMIVSSESASIHVAYSDISTSHCGFHFDSVSAFDVSYTNIHDNIYGFMLFGSSGVGPRTVTYSNVQNNSGDAFTTAGDNGPITFDKSYVAGMQDTGGVVNVTNAPAAAVTGTGPRGP